MAPLKAIVHIPKVPRAVARAFGVTLGSRGSIAAPLGRYQTYPGTRMQLYSKPFTQTVDPRNVRCRPWARLL